MYETWIENHIQETIFKNLIASIYLVLKKSGMGFNKCRFHEKVDGTPYRAIFCAVLRAMSGTESARDPAGAANALHQTTGIANHLFAPWRPLCFRLARIRDPGMGARKTSTNGRNSWIGDMLIRVAPSLSKS